MIYQYAPVVMPSSGLHFSVGSRVGLTESAIVIAGITSAWFRIEATRAKTIVTFCTVCYRDYFESLVPNFRWVYLPVPM